MSTSTASTKYFHTMIEGHGDDIYQYKNLRCNFSSNVSPFIDTKPLRDYLSTRLNVISHYPEPMARKLEFMIAKEHGVAADKVLVTSGATDAIYLIAQTFRHEGSFAIKKPTFSEYADACRMFGYEELPKGGAALRWLCNPNNPTGEVYEMDYIDLLSRRHKWLVIDQSYEDYTSCRLPALDELLDMGNVITIHSMTKRFAIPGLRLGYIIAPTTAIGQLRKNLRPWTVNSLAIEAGEWLLTHPDPYAHDRHIQLMMESDVVYNRLSSYFGLHVYHTETNFMLCSVYHTSAAELKDYLLREHGFLIRDASNFEGLKSCHFRIAVQEPEFNNELTKAIYEYTRIHAPKRKRRIDTVC